MIRHELRPMLSLAVPVILAEIGWVAMSIVDTIMVGPLGPEAIGAVAIGSSLFMAVAIFGMGLLLGLDTLVSHAFGAGRLDECRRWLASGVWLACLVAVPLTALLVLGLTQLWRWGFAPTVLGLTVPYLAIVTASLLPLLLYAALRRYLQAVNVVGPVTFALVTANLVNAIVNWILIYGRFGAPAMGVRGAAWATLLSRVHMAAILLAAVTRHVRAHRAQNAIADSQSRRERLGRLARLGFPAAAQVTLEVGVFSASTALAGRLGAVSLAAHQIAMLLASLTFMVPLGLASAAAVRVGHAVGRRDPVGIRRSGWTALALGIGFMSCSSLSFLTVPRWLIGAFTTDPGVLATGVSVLAVAAAFQPFDGIQGVATGVLRGLGDTRTPMVINLAAHWLMGLPLGYLLCFSLGWGVVGLWIGLASGLMTVGVVLATIWIRRVGHLPRMS